jgi:hypothetical protein
MALPGKALHVGIEIWFRSGLARSLTVCVSLSAIARDCGFHRAQATRGLNALVDARLISIKRGVGKKSEITILEAPTTRKAT